ncbi:SPOR domain-containing protein [Desulfobacter postgatei]|uniref:SPOR domain-containing protein n=1 Tax=Desulfobacter postgatei TaxID=2293 RepID=UPI00259B458F|nr:SPOR domain-containing protein [uncultured Desulfobacter sp.]
MFGLGVFVGRGSTPVLFETRPFQERLGRMVSERSAKLPKKEKIDLKFYDVLDEPVSYLIKEKTDDSGEIALGRETGKSASIEPTPNTPQAEKIPVKLSKKLATWYSVGQGEDNGDAPAPLLKKSASVKTDTKTSENRTVIPPAPNVLKSKKQTGKKTDAVSKETRPDSGAPVSTHGAYTIQVASYKDLNDALSRMAFLNKKGITSYRVSVTINGVTWHRIRTGSFPDQEEAGAGLAKLAGSGVNGIVIKKE